MHEYQEGCVATGAAKSVVIRRTNHHIRDESCRSSLQHSFQKLTPLPRIVLEPPRFNFDVSAGVYLKRSDNLRRA